MGVGFPYLSGWATIGVGSLNDCTAFSHQGRLIDRGLSATGTYSIRFAHFNADPSGHLLGAPVTNTLATIQGRNQKLEETRRENEELKQRLARLEKIILAQSITQP